MKWEMVKLGELADIIAGQSPESKYYNDKKDGIPFFQGKADFKIDYPSVRYWCTQPIKIARPFDILMSVRAPVGPTNICNITACIGRGLAAIRVGDKLDYKFLYHYCKLIENQIASQGNGSTFSAITTSVIKELQIPLPPLPIQKRIVEILDAADALRRKDQELLKKYDELAQAIFIDMFGDPVKNEKGFKTVCLGDCLDNIQIGPFGTQLHESDYIKNGIPVINPMHIGDLKIKPNINYSISEQKFRELPEYHLKVNDVILARRGEMGRCAIVKEQQGKCLCGTGSLYMTVNKEVLDPLFLVYTLSRKSTKIALENVSTGTTMANLNKSIIINFKMILPDLKRQKDFVNAVQYSEKSIEHLMGSVSKSDYFFNSLLQKAFSGELVV